MNRAAILALSAYVLLLTVAFWVSIAAGFGAAESLHRPDSVWLYARRILMIALALWLPKVTGGIKVASYGWSISLKWLAAAAFLGILIGYGNPGGFNPALPSALALACFHAFATELFFRAYLITVLSKCFASPWPPVLISSVMYGISYLTVWTMWDRPWAGRILFACLFALVGAVFGYCYKKSGSFLVPWLIHFLGVLKYGMLL